MKPIVGIVTGSIMVLAGLLLALLYVGVYLIADCPPGCVARGERLVVVALIVAGLAIAAGGVATIVMSRRKMLAA